MSSTHCCALLGASGASAPALAPPASWPALTPPASWRDLGEISGTELAISGAEIAHELGGEVRGGVSAGRAAAAPTPPPSPRCEAVATVAGAVLAVAGAVLAVAGAVLAVRLAPGVATWLVWAAGRGAARGGSGVARPSTSSVTWSRLGLGLGLGLGLRLGLGLGLGRGLGLRLG